MKKYLLSVCYPAGASQPPPAALNQIMSDVIALQREMQSAGVWVFSGGLYAAKSPTVTPHPKRDNVLTDRAFVSSKEQNCRITNFRGSSPPAALFFALK